MQSQTDHIPTTMAENPAVPSLSHRYHSRCGKILQNIEGSIRMSHEALGGPPTGDGRSEWTVVGPIPGAGEGDSWSACAAPPAAGGSPIPAVRGRSTAPPAGRPRSAARARGKPGTWRGGPRPPPRGRRTQTERRPMWWRGSRSGRTTTCASSGYRSPAGRAGGGRRAAWAQGRPRAVDPAGTWRRGGRRAPEATAIGARGPAGLAAPGGWAQRAAEASAA